MPEGDTVFRAARLLDRTLAGRVLTAERLPGPAARHRRPLRGPRARHLVARQAPAHPDRHRPALDPPHPPQDGGRPGTATCAASAGAARPTRRGSCSRPTTGSPSASRSASSSCSPREQEDAAVGHLGPDLLGPDWDEEEAVRRLREDPDRPLATRCSTRPGSPASATCTSPRSASSPGSIPRTRGRPGARPAAPGPPGPADARRQQGAAAAEHHRRPAPGAADVGLPPRPAAVPALRHHGGGRDAGRRPAASGRRTGARAASREPA